MFSALLLMGLSSLVSSSPMHQEEARAPACIYPGSYQVNGFQYFTPSAGNTNPANLHFTFRDSATGLDTSCTKTSNATASGSLSEANFFYACEDKDLEFAWDGKTLRFLESRACLTSTSSSVLRLSTYCFPSYYPFGTGTLCQTPTGEIGGSFTSPVTVNTTAGTVA